MKSFILSILILLSIGSRANDTLRYLSEEEFIQIVRIYHPVAKQAQLLVDRAKAELTASRAGFDPAFYLQTDRR
jgi:hypothetical protein